MQGNRLGQKLIAQIKFCFGLKSQDDLANFECLNIVPRKILCIVSAGLGDVLMNAGVIKGIKSQFPQAQITAMVEYKRHADVLCQMMPFIDATIDGPEKINKRSPLKWAIRFLRFIQNVRKQRFDLVICFIPEIKLKFIAVHSGAPYWLLVNRLDDYPGLVAAQSLEEKGIKIGISSNLLEIGEAVDAGVAANMPRPWISLHPFSSASIREWSRTDEMVQLLKGLGGTVIILGRSAKYNPINGIVDVVNKLSITQSCQLIKKSDVLISVDSGPMHIAFACGTPTVAIFGAVPPKLRVLPGTKNVRVLYNSSAGTGDNPMDMITVEQVIEATKELLKQTYHS